MSGGHYGYQYHWLLSLADEIEDDFKEGGKYLDDDWVLGHDIYGKYHQKEYDFLDDTTPEQRVIILEEIQNLIKDLRSVAHRSKCLEWFQSGDTSADSYLKELKND